VQELTYGREVESWQKVKLPPLVIQIKPPGHAMANKKPFWKESWFGTLAQWAAFVGMVVLYLVSQYHQNSSETLTLRIDNAVNEHLDKKLAPIFSELSDLTGRVGS
jgi:hypothetical protein